ncbi:HD domain-containing protein [Mycobacterium xenopi]|uniref:Metal-dependent phosphohydrolase n=1 Tax=Mycobacterium xenopi TaxID=1789 RepID=A0AAD1H367_MYCXE|nr:HD domain-containing protein [Mycobacterium xenopi]MDA3641689.1 HD domain-containing protein [Mycobacterium xenopi]MDA3660043.1 HD domain-containing protein [Mycobacterium xenopi]MDA3663915.1 HD domain-containing protein [Mycobacterium xenopi]ORX13019.1 diguanylate cyclase [Mycobacterium xenopi]SPX92660.1 metal-dependent phosphohydrolase [Mycobacterium xenopi]
MSSSTTESIAGVVIPDTPLVREVTDFIRDAEDDLLFHHSRRVFLFGALQGQRRGLQPDLELLYVGAMFHDLGLTERYRTSTLRFEVDGANAARDFLLARGVDETDARRVWLGIALHTTPGVPEFLEPEIALVTAGVETDVVGIGRDDLSPEALAAVTAAHPRPDFKRRILQAFTNGMRHRPATTFGTMNADVLAHYDESFIREDMVEKILNNAWPEWESGTQISHSTPV